MNPMPAIGRRTPNRAERDSKMADFCEKCFDTGMRRVKGSGEFVNCSCGKPRTTDAICSQCPELFHPNRNGQDPCDLNCKLNLTEDELKRRKHNK